jgi:signal transduction histidine kinase
VTCEDERAILEVVDRGMGVPESERDRLFAPFSRAPSAVESGVSGTGLGLYISRRIVEAHGGSIELRDTPGGGATFRVTLPVRRSAATQDAA